jgi:uncharacterized protein involved in exopolysaccharide biosynthesis
MGPIHSLDDLVDMLRRHFRLIVGLVLLGCFVSLIHAQKKQHMFRASEVIQIERPRIANELAPSTVAGSTARRLQLIEQQIMARASLQSIIEKFALYQDTPEATLTEKVNRLRQSVRIEGVAAVREGYGDDGTVAVLTISAEMPTAEQAQAVAQEFSDRTIALSIDSRVEQTRATLEFFSRREAALIAEISALEERIEAFRAENDLANPGTLEVRRAEVATINQAILEIDRTRITVQRQLERVDSNGRRATVERETAELNSQLGSLDQQRALLVDRAAQLSDIIETNPAVERELAAFERQLQQFQSQMDVAATRRAEAEVGVRLEAQHNAESMTVIEAASLPDYPYTSSKKKLALMGALASVLGALGIAFVLDWRSGVIRTAAQMKREVGIMPVVSIPYLAARPVRRPLWVRLRGALYQLIGMRPTASPSPRD